MTSSIIDQKSPVVNHPIVVHGDMTLADLNALALGVVATLDGAARDTAVLQLADIRSLSTDGGRKIGLIRWLIARMEGK